MPWWGDVLVAAAVVVGVLGVVVPVLPGLLLVWGAVAAWGVIEGGPTGWSVAVAATALAVASQVLKITVPGRRLRRAGVPTASITIGGLVGIVGFFVIPLVGLFVGFVLGVYGAERRRLDTHDAAWASTRHAVTAAGLSVLIELAATLLIAAGWLAGLVLA